jgi:DNA-binding HxlR family transcriptional regulator
VSPSTTDLDLTRDALATSTLSHGLKLLGDRWTVQVLLGTFMGIRRFDDWQAQLGMSRHTLAERLKSLMALGLLKPRRYQDRPPRQAYHATAKAMALYPQTLMIWAWERRWGSRDVSLPRALRHRPCGQVFDPQLACAACGDDVTMKDLSFSLRPNSALPAETAGPLRSPRLSASAAPRMGLGLRLDRWSLLIITAVVLGCRYFDQLSHVLGIGPSVLAKRLAGMVESDLLRCEVDRSDARRRVYRLTPASRGLFGYIVCVSTWASEHHFHQRSAIEPRHTCGHAFVPRVVCSCCRQPLQAWDVQPELTGAGKTPAADTPLNKASDRKQEALA